MKILFLDIETSPNTAYVWGLWKENIPLARLIESSDVMCWSAKWMGQKEVMFSSINDVNPNEMLEAIHKLLDEADVVVHYNGLSFDIPCLNKEFLIYGMNPPAPYKNVDLYKTVRSQFKFTSNKLDHVIQRLGIGQKIETDFKLWVNCMNYDPVAWKQMERYNKNDVVVLEKLYNRLKPWIPSHPNYTLYSKDNDVMCPTCGSKKYQLRGYTYNTVGKYQRYQCKSCGRWFRDRKNLATKQTLIVT